MFPPLGPIQTPSQPAEVEQHHTAEYETFDPPPATISVEQISAAPRYLGIHVVNSSKPPVNVDGKITFQVEEMEGTEIQFCLRASHREETKVLMLPLPSSQPPTASDVAFHPSFIGPYRFRVVKTARITEGGSTSSQWVSDLPPTQFYVLAVAVDEPVCLTSESYQGPNRDVTVLQPLEEDQSMEFWLSTRNPKHQHLVLGQDASDQLDLRLSSQLLSPLAATLSLKEDGEWEKRLEVEDDQIWRWSASLDLLRLGDVEAHQELSLNYSRSSAKVGVGRLRPESKTKSRRGRVIRVGDYQIEVKERVGMLLQFGTHLNQDQSRVGNSEKTESDSVGEEEDDSSGDEWIFGSTAPRPVGPGPRAIGTEYQVLDLSVLVKISREGMEQAQEAAWSALLQ